MNDPEILGSILANCFNQANRKSPCDFKETDISDPEQNSDPMQLSFTMCAKERARRFKTVGAKAVAFVTPQEQGNDGAARCGCFSGDSHGFRVQDLAYHEPMKSQKR